jgi:hypothetical protein
MISRKAFPNQSLPSTRVLSIKTGVTSINTISTAANYTSKSQSHDLEARIRIMVGFACFTGDTVASVEDMVGELGCNCSGEERERCDDGENIMCACHTD